MEDLGTRLFELNIEELTEEEAVPIAIEVLESRKADNLSGLGCGCGCSLILLLLSVLIFQDVSPDAGEPLTDDVTSVMDYFRCRRLLKKLRNGTYKGSAADYLKLFRAEMSRGEIWHFMPDLKKRVKEGTADFDGVQKYIDCYRDYCLEHPKFKLKNVDRAIETIARMHAESLTQAKTDGEQKNALDKQHKNM